MFGIGRPKDKKYYDDGAHSFGKRDKYTSLFSKPEEEYYFKSDPNALYHTYGFSNGGINSRYKLPVEETEAYGIGGNVSDVATWLFGDATTKVKNFLKAHGDESIESVELGRVPIQAAISTAMNLLSKGEYNKTMEKKGYDAFFHLFIVINDKYRLEKNQNVNVITNYSRADDEDRISLGTSKNTINEFFDNAIKKMGKDSFWRDYNALSQNCQWWSENTIAANGLSRSKANDFAFQDTQELRDAINPQVQEAMKETTDLASGIDKFLSWLTGGAWGLAKGGMVRHRIGRMK